MLRTQTQNKKLYALLNRLGIDKQVKAELVRQFSHGRTDSTAQMNYMECQSLIAHLASQTKPLRQDLTEPVRRMRAKVVAIARDLGYIKVKVHTTDWERFNSFMSTRSCLKKPLSKYTVDELPQLVTQWESMQAKEQVRRRKQIKVIV